MTKDKASHIGPENTPASTMAAVPSTTKNPHSTHSRSLIFRSRG